MKIFVATYPFGAVDKRPLELLRAKGWEVILNPLGRRLRAGEVGEHLEGVDAVIAGTEPYNAETLAGATSLKAVCRVGIGLDSVDLAYCRDHGLRVTYTPDAPSDGVAELTVANIINLLRHVHASDRSVREHAWNRLMGRLLCETNIGIVGVGRIGTKVIQLLEPFGPRILAYDRDPAVTGRDLPHTEWCDLDRLLAESDLISVHIPLNDENRHFINRARIQQMKTGALLINTARGPVVDTAALVDALLQRHLDGAALDVFEEEPYDGPMARMDNVVLTAHIGASARLCRYRMELGAAEDCIRILSGEAPRHDAVADELEDG